LNTHTETQILDGPAVGGKVAAHLGGGGGE